MYVNRKELGGELREGRKGGEERRGAEGTTPNVHNCIIVGIYLTIKEYLIGSVRTPGGSGLTINSHPL